MPELVEAGAWRCDGCERLSAWSGTHRWYGAWSDVDGGSGAPGRPRAARAIVVACSEACAIGLVVAGRIPAVGEDGSTAVKPR